MGKNSEHNEQYASDMTESQGVENLDSGFNHPDINRVFIAGTLLHDPPLRRTRKGVPVTNFIVITKPESPAHADEGFEREPEIGRAHV